MGDAAVKQIESVGFNAEESVVGGVLVHQRKLADVARLIAPPDFRHPGLRVIYEAMVELDADAKPIDLLTVIEQMRSAETLEQLRVFGGEDYLVELMSKVVTVENIGYHARLVAESAANRRKLEAVSGLRQALLDDDEERVGLYERRLDDARARRVGDAVPLLAGAAAQIEWSRPMPKALSTGIVPLDERLGGGLLEQATYLLVGAEGRGKSGLTIQLLRELAGRGTPVVYISAELPPRQVLARFAAQIIGTSWLDLLKLDPSAAHVVTDALAALPIYVHRLGREEPLTEVVARIADKTGTAPIFAVDYIQKAARRGGAADYRFAVAACMDGIVQCALDLRTSAIVVSSTGRATSQGAAEQTDPRALAQTAKENGDLEFDASAVMYLDVAEREPGGTAPTRLVVGKSRFGLDGVVGLRFDGRIGVFELDAAGALSELDRQVLDAIRGGAGTSEDASKAIGKRKADVLKAIKRLAGANLIAPKSARGSDWIVVE